MLSQQLPKQISEHQFSKTTPPLPAASTVPDVLALLPVPLPCLSVKPVCVVVEAVLVKVPQKRQHRPALPPNTPTTRSPPTRNLATHTPDHRSQQQAAKCNSEIANDNSKRQVETSKRRTASNKHTNRN